MGVSPKRSQGPFFGGWLTGGWFGEDRAPFFGCQFEEGGAVGSQLVTKPNFWRGK